MDTQETQFRTLYEQFLAWQASQQQQTDGYAFEQSFELFTQQLNQQLLAITLQATPSTADSPPLKKK